MNTMADLRATVGMIATGGGLIYVAGFLVGGESLLENTWGGPLFWILTGLTGIQQFIRFKLGLIDPARLLTLVAFALIIAAFIAVGWRSGLASILGAIGGAFVGSGFTQIGLSRR